MRLRDEILKEHSKKQTNRIVEWVGASQERFNRLFDLFLNDEYRVVQRAAWAVSSCVMNHPELIRKKISKLVTYLQQPGLDVAVKRNSIRLLQYVEIPVKYHGYVMDTCFRFLEDPAEAVAVKAFAITVLGKLARQYPEIIPEIKLLISEQLPHQSAAFRVRAREFMKQMQE